MAGDFYADRERGYYWGEDIKKKTSKEKVGKVEVKEIKPPLTVVPTATQARERMQKKVQEVMDTALMNPNDKKAVSDLLKVQLLSFARAENVVSTSKLLLLENPELDMLRESPVNHEARLVHNREKEIKETNVIREVAKGYGLIFFFSSRCPSCGVMARSMNAFKLKHDFKILAITMDGIALPEFPDALPDNGVSRHYEVNYFPSVFMVNPKNGESFPIAQRASSLKELEEAILEYKKAGVLKEGIKNV
mgnify:FL=1